MLGFSCCCQGALKTGPQPMVLFAKEPQTMPWAIVFKIARIGIPNASDAILASKEWSCPWQVAYKTRSLIENFCSASHVFGKQVEHAAHTWLSSAWAQLLIESMRDLKSCYLSAHWVGIQNLRCQVNGLKPCTRHSK